MSKEVDALVIIGHSHMIAHEAPPYAFEDISQGLWYVRHGKTTWYDGEPITENDKTNLYAGEVFLELGKLASSRYCQVLPERPQNPNPFREVALDVLEEISPFQAGEALPQALAIPWANMKTGARQLPQMFDTALTTNPSLADELSEKWAQALTIHVQRGTVATMAYNTQDLIGGMSALNMNEIAPDAVEFDEDANLASQSHNVHELAVRAGVQARMTEIPYYQTFSDTNRNEEEMLTAALADLKLVSQALATV